MSRNSGWNLAPIWAIAASLVLGAYLTSPVNAALGTSERRVALVIGNGAYTHTSPLENPRNDAQDMAASLKTLGFEVVLGIDLNFEGMRNAIRTFAEKLNGADVGALFYAGHGIQYQGRNFLVPTDASLVTPTALDFQMVTLASIQSVMEAAVPTNVIFLDACRDNPLARNLVRALGTRSAGVGRGLAQVEAGVGTLISYATQPGNVALDGDGRNSPYTAALKTHITTPNEDITSVLINVRNDVMAATRQQQVPWDQHALRSKLTLAALPAAPTTGSSSATISDATTLDAGDAATVRRMEASDAWSLVSNSQRADDYVAFLELYGASNPFLARLARNRVAALGGTAPPSPADASDVVSNPTAVAAVSKPSEGPVTSPDEGEPSIPALSGRALVRAVQTELKRASCYRGRIDGVWGRQSRRATAALSEQLGQDVGSEPTLELHALALTAEAGTCAAVEPVASVAARPQTSCATGQKRNSRGQCYTPRKSGSTSSTRSGSTRKACRSGQKRNSRGQCYTPRQRASGSTSTTRKTRTKRSSGGAGNFSSRSKCRKAASTDPEAGGWSWICG